jgi:hypothetical protein
METATEKEDGLLCEKDLQQIVKAISSIKYGSVTLFIQDGKLVQIDKNEKIRLV